MELEKGTSVVAAKDFNTADTVAHPAHNSVLSFVPHVSAPKAKERLEPEAQACASLPASTAEKCSASKLMREKIKATFTKLDADKNGTLTFEELYGVMLQVGIDSDEVRSVLTSMDANRNGVIDFNEFVDWLYDGIVDTSCEQIDGLLDAMLNVQVGDDVLLKDQGVQARVLSRTTTDLQVKMPDGAVQSVAIEDLSRI